MPTDPNHEPDMEWRLVQLERERFRYRQVFLFAPVACVFTSNDGTIREANPAARELLAGQDRALVGTSFLELVPRDEQQELLARISALARGGEGATWEMAVCRGSTGRRVPVRAVAVATYLWRLREFDAGGDATICWILTDQSESRGLGPSELFGPTFSRRE